MAPESMHSSLYSPASDVYAFGIVAWELLHESSAYSGSSDFDIMDQVVNQRKPLTVDSLPIDHQVKDTINGCLLFKPEDRPTAEKICAVMQAVNKKSPISVG